MRIWFSQPTHVEAGSNTSTVTLRIVGGDEKESLKSETVKHGHPRKTTLAKKKNSVVLVRKRNIPIERSPPVSEASANFSG
jgi:hypothetical protein